MKLVYTQPENTAKLNVLYTPYFFDCEVIPPEILTNGTHKNLIQGDYSKKRGII